MPEVTDLEGLGLMLGEDLAGDLELDKNLGASDWPETIHPFFFDKINRFFTKLPKAATLSAPFLRSLGVSQQVLSWAAEGVKFNWRWGKQPPRHFGKNNKSVYAESDFIDLRVLEYLEAGVVKEIDKQAVICSLPLKVVISGAAGKKRLIWVGCFVNTFLPCPKFKYETLETFICMMQKDALMGRVDCASGYHTIPVNEAFKPFLCFFWKEKFYCFNVLPFGLAVAPWIYTTVMRELTRIWRKKGLNLLQYLDDSAWVCMSVDAWRQHACLVIDLLQGAGFWLGLEKCVLRPSKEIEFLGFNLSSADLSVSLPDRRVQAIVELGRKMLLGCKLEDVRSFCGRIVSAERISWTCRVYLRQLFVILKICRDVTPMDAPFVEIQLSEEEIWELNYWISNVHSGKMPLSVKGTAISFNTDASAYAWGGHWAEFEDSGMFSVFEAQKSSTFRELLALRLFFLRHKDKMMYRSEPVLETGRVTSIGVLNPIVDNSAVPSILKWGSRNRQINNMVKDLWNLSWAKGFIWRPAWVSRVFNTRADRLSKPEGFVLVLNPRAFELCFYNKRLQPTVQVFTGREGVLPALGGKFWHMQDPEAAHVDFMSFDWKEETIPLATPDWPLLAKVLGHVRDIAKKAIIVCPWWKGATWWPLLEDMKIWAWTPPWGVPMFRTIGGSEPRFSPLKLRHPSAFFLVDGALPHRHIH